MNRLGRSVDLIIDYELTAHLSFLDYGSFLGPGTAVLYDDSVQIWESVGSLTWHEFEDE